MNGFLVGNFLVEDEVWSPYARVRSLYYWFYSLATGSLFGICLCCENMTFGYWFWFVFGVFFDLFKAGAKAALLNAGMIAAEFVVLDYISRFLSCIKYLGRQMPRPRLSKTKELSGFCSFKTTGCLISSFAVRRLLKLPDIWGLWEFSLYFLFFLKSKLLPNILRWNCLWDDESINMVRISLVEFCTYNWDFPCFPLQFYRSNMISPKSKSWIFQIRALA
jgi:hypothetical protein